MTDDAWTALGLEGRAPLGDPPSLLHTEIEREPTELWGFRAGIKPVVFLTVPPDRVEATRRHFEGAHVEQRARRVHVEPGDRWTDDRTLGEPRVELYISNDPALAREACALQSEDPTRSAARLGELLGYPTCCVDAFRRQPDRSDNTRNRYETALRTNAPTWQFELDNLAMMFLPFFPCTYVCAAATELARQTLDALRTDDRDAARVVEAILRRPVLYFGHDELVCFDGQASSRDTIEYTRALVPRTSTARARSLASALGRGDRLTLGSDALSVSRSGATLFELRRIDPAVGFVAPFA